MTSYACWVFVDGDYSTNGLRFASHAEAMAYGSELLSRWFAPTGYEARPSTDPVNAHFDTSNGTLTHLEDTNATPE